MNVTTTDRAVKTSAWVLYTLIVLEILFMVSPFAAYYYSIYATPLNVLQASPTTAWLTMYVLPHFAYSDSWLANGLILLSWPLILIGGVVFLFGFCQIYWSKITRKGTVEGGLYRHIRHPQYVALALIGLGASLYWSRFVVILAFVSMLFLYYLLARTEEGICQQKFGESYRRYLDTTGMFIPRRWEAGMRRLAWRLPEATGRKIVVIAGLYIVAMGLTVGMAQSMRNHVIDSLQTEARTMRVAVFLAPVSEDLRKRVAALLDQAAFPGHIAYVAPSSWRVPELGLRGSGDDQSGAGVAELFHPTTHGNALSFDSNRLSVVAVEAVYSDTGNQGIALLSGALNVEPIESADIDLAAGDLVGRKAAGESQWAGIPVPTF